MPKRKTKSKNVESKKHKSEAAVEELLLEARETSSSTSSSSDSDSSSSDDYHKRKKFSKKSKKSQKHKKSLRKIQNQIDLFQRNMDVKLNYIESLLQTVIKNKNSSSSQRQPLPSNSRLPLATVPRVKPIALTKGSSATKSGGTKDLDTLDSLDALDSATAGNLTTSAYSIPSFPITEADFVFEFDKTLRDDSNFRQTLASVLHAKAKRLRSATQSGRVKALMYYMFEMELLCQFSWTGMNFNVRGTTKKHAFRSCIGIIALVRSAMNYGVEQMSDDEFIHGIRDALKRAPDKLKLGVKVVPKFPFDDADDKIEECFFKEERSFGDNDDSGEA